MVSSTSVLFKVLGSNSLPVTLTRFAIITVPNPNLVSTGIVITAWAPTSNAPKWHKTVPLLSIQFSWVEVADWNITLILS